ncbi:MAG: APC family permease [Mycobacteriales bacterium]
MRLVPQRSSQIAADRSERKLAQLFGLRELVPLSVSSVGPMFSVAATGGVMAAQAGWWTLPALGMLAVPFIILSFVFRLLNRHFPHSGASYHWTERVIGRRASRYQAWIVILAYFASIPPIAIPAGSYTLALVAPNYRAPTGVHLAVTLFWMAFAAVPLLRGSRPTARITQVFFAVEMFSLIAFATVGALEWNRLAVPIHFGPPPVGGILIVAVIAATVLDGWEINSYAAEESTNPRGDPGTAGIIGALGAVLFYAILYPLLLAETPSHSLANSVDPLAMWSQRLVPGAPWLMLIPVLLSTAGGLWLTSFILTRALYAMGRDGLIPGTFARLNKNNVPSVAILASLAAAACVVTVQLFVAALASFFNLVLSAAGFFLLAEFFLDSVTACVFLASRHRRRPEVGLPAHSHRLLLAGSLFSSVALAALMVAFFVYGPVAIGHGIDPTLVVLLLLSVGFAWWTGSRVRASFALRGRGGAQGDGAAAVFVSEGPFARSGSVSNV